MGGDTSNTVPLGRRYWQAQSNAPTILEKKNTWVKQQKAIKDRKDKALRKWLQTKGVKELNKEVKDYLTTSNDNTWVENRNPMVKASKHKNPHLTERSVKGAKAHAAWEKEHPNLTAWSYLPSAAVLGTALAPLGATGLSGISALGDAAAATSAGQAITSGLAPLVTAASTNVAGAPLYTWADAGLSSVFGAHGIQTAINEGGISPTTALEIAPLGRLARPIFNKAATAIENYRYPIGRPQVPENFLTVKPQVRTRVGDVEIDNPNLLYHLDRGDEAGAFSTQGAYVEDGFLFPGTPKDASDTPYSWWNKGKPYATAVNGQPMTRLMTTTEDTPEMLHVRSQNYPIGQWNGKRGLVLNSEYVNPEGVNVSKSTYTLDPNYGWRRVFAEEAPTIEWTDAVKPPKITSENAASITPEQWTAAQDAAIAKGDMAEAQRLKDLHFRTKASDNMISKPEGWHQTNTNFNAFDLGRSNNKNLDALGITGVYTKNTDADILGTQYPIQMRVNRYAKKPLEINTKTDLLDIIPGLKEKVQEYKNIYDTKRSLLDLLAERSNPNTTAIRKTEINKQIRAFQDNYQQQLYKAIEDNKSLIDNYLKENNYDAVLIKKDYSGNGLDNFGRYTDTEVLLSPSQIKLADAVTFDDNGVRIPLGERDNFKLNDLRYGLLPFGIGLTGYGLLNNQKTSRGSARKGNTKK